MRGGGLYITSQRRDADVPPGSQATTLHAYYAVGRTRVTAAANGQKSPRTARAYRSQTPKAATSGYASTLTRS